MQTEVEGMAPSSRGGAGEVLAPGSQLGRCGGSKDSIKEGKALVSGSRRCVYKVGSRGG